MEKPSPTANLAQQTAARIRAEILSGSLTPGSMVSAGKLAEQFGVSRTPVREALLQLESAGMVRIEKNRGATILATSLEDLIEVFQLRLLLEVPAAGHAARVRTPPQLAEILECFARMQREADAAPPPEGAVEPLLLLDRDLHALIARAAGIERLAGMLTELRNLVLTRGVGTTPHTRSRQEVVDDHVDLVRAIERRDAPAARAAMHRHITNTARLLIRQEAAGRSDYDEAWVHDRLDWL